MSEQDLQELKAALGEFREELAAVESSALQLAAKLGIPLDGTAP